MNNHFRLAIVIRLENSFCIASNFTGLASIFSDRRHATCEIHAGADCNLQMSSVIPSSQAEAPATAATVPQELHSNAQFKGCDATERAGAELWFMKMQRQVRDPQIQSPAVLTLAFLTSLQWFGPLLKRDARCVSRSQLHCAAVLTSSSWVMTLRCSVEHASCRNHMVSWTWTQQSVFL